jgi:hypothetical protein
MLCGDRFLIPRVGLIQSFAKISHFQKISQDFQQILPKICYAKLVSILLKAIRLSLIGLIKLSEKFTLREDGKEISLHKFWQNLLTFCQIFTNVPYKI